MHTSEAWEEGSLVHRLYQLVLRSCTKCAPCMEHNYFNIGSVQFKPIEQDHVHVLKHDMQVRQCPYATPDYTLACHMSNP